MIEAGVKISEGFIAEGGDFSGIAAGLECVHRIREKCVQAVAGKHRVRRGKGPFHLIVNDTFIGKATLFTRIKVPALLLENFFRDTRKKNRVQVYVRQVSEVLEIGAGHGVAGLIRIGEGIEKGLQGAFEQFDKGLLDRVFFRAAEHAVFKNMGHAGGIGRGRAKGNAENLVLVIIKDGEQGRARCLMPPQSRCGGYL